MAENENSQAGAQEQPQGPQFGVQKVYTKDISFETPMGVKVFLQNPPAQPQIKVDVNTRASTLAENMHESILTITVSATINDETAFLIEIQQAGIFQISGFPDEQLKHALAAVCPNFLFPYAREAIDSTAVRGGFGPLNLAPIDFDQLFRQSQQQGAEGQPLNS